MAREWRPSEWALRGEDESNASFVLLCRSEKEDAEEEEAKREIFLLARKTELYIKDSGTQIGPAFSALKRRVRKSFGVSLDVYSRNFVVTH